MWQMHYLSAGCQAASAALAGMWASLSEIFFLVVVLICFAIKLPWLLLKWTMTSAKALLYFLAFLFMVLTLTGLCLALGYSNLCLLKLSTAMAFATAALTTFSLVAACIEYYVMIELQSSSDKLGSTHGHKKHFKSVSLTLSGLFGFLTMVMMWSSAFSAMGLQAAR